MTVLHPSRIKNVLYLMLIAHTDHTLFEYHFIIVLEKKKGTFCVPFIQNFKNCVNSMERSIKD